MAAAAAQGISDDASDPDALSGHVFGGPVFYGTQPFVNRYAETFDLFAIEHTPSDKYPVAFTYQLMGSGKTALGLNAVGVLRRPREAAGEEEDFVAERLRHSLILSQPLLKDRAGDMIARAKNRTEDETLVARVLREYLTLQYNSSIPANAAVDAAKNAVTVFVSLTDASTNHFTTLASLISYAICKAVGVSSPSLDVDETCAAVSAAVGGRAVLLVLDEIGVLGEPEYRHLIGFNPSEQKSVYAAAMQSLRDSINEVYGSKSGFMVYCTGRAEWLTMSALAGPTSPLRATAVLLSPLQARDILEIMRRTPECSGSKDPAVQRHLADAIARKSGGVGRVVIAALEALRDNYKPVTTTSEANVLLGMIEKRMMKQLSYAFPKASADPNEWRDPALLTTIGRMVLFGKRFEESEEVSLQLASGTISVPITSALTALGLNFAPAPNDASMLVPVAGDWHLQIIRDSLIHVEGTMAFELLSVLRRTGKEPESGKLFESLSIYQTARLVAASVAPGARRAAGEIFPFLRGTSAERATLGHRLRIRELPMVTSSARQLTEEQKQDVNVLNSLETIHPSDLHWLLHEVLQEDEVGIPQGNSRSQDWFIRARGAVIGFPNKMINQLQCHLVKEELDNRPVPCADDDPYVLVNLTPVLGPELEEAMGNRSALLLTEAEVRERGCRPDPAAPAQGARRDIVIVSPSHEEGLSRLLTQEVCKHLRVYATSETPDVESFRARILAMSIA
jgi:hypothetical protein